MLTNSDWTTKKVLDHGFIHLLDAMPHWDKMPSKTGMTPADARVVQAARVSMAHLPEDILASLNMDVDYEIRTAEQDARLIRYMMKNGHTSPFEKVRLEFVAKIPIFVARQWIRHRMGCLAGDVQLHFERPCDGRAYPKSIADVFRSFSDPAQVLRAKQMRLRCVDESSLALRTTTISAIWESGVQDVYEARTQSGKTIRLTNSHQVLTVNGWELFGAVRTRFEENISVTLFGVQNVGGPGAAQYVPDLNEDRVWSSIPGWEGRYEVSDQGRIRSLLNTQGRSRQTPKIKHPTVANTGYLCVSLSRDGVSKLFTVHSLVAQTFLGEISPGMVVRHKNGNRLDSRVDNLEYGSPLQNTEDMFVHDAHCRLEVRPEPIVSIVYSGYEMTYDLEVVDGDHNFVANGLVVHNSFNEQSARYSQLPCEFYVPELDRMQLQSTSNKQASGATMNQLTAQRMREVIQDSSKDAYKAYETMLKNGLARELARMVLPTNFYTQWYWTVDLHNLMNFLKQRMHEHAQFEIRAYAQPILEMVERVAPVSIAAFRKSISAEGVV